LGAPRAGIMEMKGSAPLFYHFPADTAIKGSGDFGSERRYYTYSKKYLD
jgi:hypothetical protein